MNLCRKPWSAMVGTNASKMSWFYPSLGLCIRLHCENKTVLNLEYHVTRLFACIFLFFFSLIERQTLKSNVSLVCCRYSRRWPIIICIVKAMHDSFTLDLGLVSYDFISVCCPLWFLRHQAFLPEHVSPHLTSPFYYVLLELTCKENAKLRNWFDKSGV